MNLQEHLAIIGTVTAVIGTGIAIYAVWPKPDLVDKNSRFYCDLQFDSDRKEEVWTVIYRHDKGPKAWLKMVENLGPDWNTPKRCEEIARRLNIYRQDGLMELTYRDDPNTPRQYVICAKTRLSPGSCPLLVTLKLNAQPYETLSGMISALSSDGSGSIYLGSNGRSPISSFSPASPVINLENLLAEEDRKAGSSATK